MKSLFLVLLFAFGAVGIHAQYEYKTVKLTISVPTIQGDLCKDRIEQYLGRNYGIAFSEVNIRKKTVKVEYYKERIQPNLIRQLISGIGYDADTYLADPAAYNKLPAECKIPGILSKEIPKEEAPKEFKNNVPKPNAAPTSKYQQFVDAKKAQEQKAKEQNSPAPAVIPEKKEAKTEPEQKPIAPSTPAKPPVKPTAKPAVKRKG